MKHLVNYGPCPDFIPVVSQIIKGAVGDVHFDHYQDGKLWYGVQWAEIVKDVVGLEHKDGACLWSFKFPVPIEDTGTGHFAASDRPIFFMRWIRREVARLTEHELEIVQAKAEWAREMGPNE